MKVRRLAVVGAVLALASAVSLYVAIPAFAEKGTATPEATAEATEGGADTPGGGRLGAREPLLGLGFGGSFDRFDAAADALGLTPTELFEQLHDGLTLSEVAEAQGVDIEIVDDAIRAAEAKAGVEAGKERIAAAVEAGTMTQEEADWLLEGIEQGYAGGVPGRGDWAMRGGSSWAGPDGAAGDESDGAQGDAGVGRPRGGMPQALAPRDDAQGERLFGGSLGGHRWSRGGSASQSGDSAADSVAGNDSAKQ